MLQEIPNTKAYIDDVGLVCETLDKFIEEGIKVLKLFCVHSW